MKRIMISILIGAGFCLLGLGFIKFFENGFLNSRRGEPLFDGELKIKIGNTNDNSNLIKATLSQLRNRNSIDVFSTQQIDKNTFQVSAKGIHDTVIFKKLLTAPGEIEFIEVFNIGDIQNLLTTIEAELTKKREKYEGTLKIDTNLLSAKIEIEELARKNGYRKLSELINFSPPYHDNNGRVIFPAGIGTIIKNDTGYLNKILRDEVIMMNFTEPLKFAYSDYDKSAKSNDSLMTLYVLKIVDQRYNPNPTGDQIVDVRYDHESTTGLPVIMFAFNARGSEAWHQMTKNNVGKPIAILLDNVVLTAPVVESAIEGGEARISGGFTVEEAAYIATMMRSRKLILPVKIIEQHFTASKKSNKTLWILLGVFLLMASLSYGISFLIKPASKS